MKIIRRRRRRQIQKQTIRRCHRCRGLGYGDCPICGGSGQVRKGSDALGNPQFQPCTGCFGVRRTRCTPCSGTGYLQA